MWQCQQKPPATEKCLQSLSGPWSPGHRCAGIHHLSSGCRHGCQGARAAIFVTRKQPTFHICPQYNNHSPAAPRPVVMSKPLSWCNYRVSCVCCSPPAQSLSLAAAVAASSFSISIFLLHICLTCVAHINWIVLWILIKFMRLKLNCTNNVVSKLKPEICFNGD